MSNTARNYYAAWYDGPYYHRPFDPAALVTMLRQAMILVPGCSVGRAGNDIANLVIYDADGQYVGVIDLHDPPELNLFEADDG